MKPKNHGKIWSARHQLELLAICALLKDKNDMRLIIPILVNYFERTDIAICKRIETIKGWYWAS